MSDGVTMGKLVKAYVKLREHRAECTRLYEEQDAKLKADLQKLEIAMGARLAAEGSNSTNTEFGTAYRQIEAQATVSDWKAFYDWIIADPSGDRFEALQKRVKTGFITEHMERTKVDDETLGPPPPGVNVMRQYVTRVRKA